MEKNSKKMFKYEKEHKKNPQVCRICGVESKSMLFNGVCNECYKRMVREAGKPENVFRVSSEEGNIFRK